MCIMLSSIVCICLSTFVALASAIATSPRGRRAAGVPAFLPIRVPSKQKTGDVTDAVDDWADVVVHRQHTGGYETRSSDGQRAS